MTHGKGNRGIAASDFGSQSPPSPCCSSWFNTNLSSLSRAFCNPYLQVSRAVDAQLLLGAARRQRGRAVLWVWCLALPLPQSCHRGGLRASRFRRALGTLLGWGCWGQVLGSLRDLPVAVSSFGGGCRKGTRFLYRIRRFVHKQTPYYKELAR